MLSRTWAPWYVVPANSKWYRDLVVAKVLVETLEGLGMRYPEPEFDPEEIRIE
jgi:polyphosphate kinase 2 (PPK2 family)